MGSETAPKSPPSSLWCRRIFAVSLGTVWALAFPTFNVAGLAWLTPGLLLALSFGSTPREQLQYGFLTGFVFQLITLRWLLNIPVTFLPILGWAALSAFLALFPALWLRLTWVLAPHRTRANTPHSCQPATSWSQPWIDAAQHLQSTTWFQRCLWTFSSACLWVAWEMIQTRIFSGFPWNLLATSQGSMLIFAQIAEFTGVYGLSFLMVVTSLSLLHATLRLLQSPQKRLIWQSELAVAFVLLMLAGGFGWTRLQSSPPSADHDRLRIALIQPSIPQTMIWNPNEDESRWRRLFELTQKALASHPDLILWPEAATPYPLQLDPEAQRLIASLLQNGKAWLATGSDHAERIQKANGTLQTNYFNSAFLLDPQGQFTTFYPKRHLVMFGEYVPFSETLPFLRHLTPITGGFTPGTQPIPFRLPQHRAEFGMLICFEDGFPHLVREHARDVDFLVNLTNDGWFGEGGAQWQHTASALFRSIENRMSLIRCSNNGISCRIDPQGRVHDILGGRTSAAYAEGIQIVEVPLPRSASMETSRPRVTTVYQRWGDFFGWGMTLAVVFRLILKKTPRPDRAEPVDV